MRTEFLINSIVRKEIASLKVSFPAKVTSVENLSDGLISVKPIINSTDFLTGGEQEYPELFDIRVVFPSSSTSTICFPVNINDTVEVLIQSENITSFINGNEDEHVAGQSTHDNLLNCIALVGFETYQKSCFNPNNYVNDFDNQNLNIVHNKNTENEVTFTLRTDGTVGVIAPEGVDYTTKKFKVDCEEFEVNASKSSRTISPLISQNGI